MMEGRSSATAQSNSLPFAHLVVSAFAFFLLLLSPKAMAQDIKVAATLDTANILIGQQAQLELGVSYHVDRNAPKHITWPTITDTLSSKVAVIHDTHVDTILPDKAVDPYLFKQVRTITITSWDSGFWAIPPFLFVIDGDTIATDPLLLTVNTVEVDTSKAFRDIKEIYELPFNLMVWLQDNWQWLVGGTALVAILTALIIFLLKRARRPRAPAPPIPQKPLHLRTLAALDELRQQKLWEQGRTKAYYSELTGILRSYVEERFHVPAMEQTTDELMAALHLSSIGTDQREQLGHLLRLADLVKFAKWQPISAENEQMMAGAIAFVHNTADTRPDAPLP